MTIYLCYLNIMPVPGTTAKPTRGRVKSCNTVGNMASANNGPRIEAWLPQCQNPFRNRTTASGKKSTMSIPVLAT